MTDIRTARQNLSEALREYEDLTADTTYTEDRAAAANRIEDRKDLSDAKKAIHLERLTSVVKARIKTENETGRHSEDADYARAASSGWDGKNPYMGF